MTEINEHNSEQIKEQNSENSYQNSYGEDEKPEQYRSYKITNKDKNRKLRRSIILFTFILAGIILVGALFTFMKNLLFPVEDYSANGPYIATIYVEGTIASGQKNEFGLATGYQHQWTLEQLDRLINDVDNKGLLLFIDSPGGGVYESDELYLKLKEYKEITKRPVYAVMGSMAASGGYYIAAAADEIVASRNTWTGSIGVTIGTLYDFSGLLDKYGVKTVTITSGRNKSMGNFVQPMTPEQQNIFQSLVDEAYEQFVGIVSQERGLDLEKTKALADGRIYTAKQALALGLIDRVGTLEDAADQLKEKYKLQNCELVDVIYTDHSFFGSLLGGTAIPSLKQGDVAALLEIMESSNKFPISYQCDLMTFSQY